MRAQRSGEPDPPWMNDAQVRRVIAEQVRCRRAKRIRELVKFEQAVRQAERGEKKFKLRGV
jgi:hypothetical protein